MAVPADHAGLAGRRQLGAAGHLVSALGEQLDELSVGGREVGALLVRRRTRSGPRRPAAGRCTGSWLFLSSVGYFHPDDGRAGC